MDVLTVHKINEVYLRVTSEPHIEQELSDYFKFDVPQAKFMPAFRRKAWSGSIFLYSLTTKTLYCGLLKHLELFCKERDIRIEYTTEIKPQDFTVEDAKRFIQLIKPTREPRDYQIEAFVNCVREHRALTLSPTGSGKSLIIYLLTRLYTYNSSKRKALIIVPTLGLVHQMADDFVDYGCDPDEIYKIHGGIDKLPERVVVTLENGKEIAFQSNQSIKLINNYQKHKLAKDLIETDEIDDRWLAQYMQE